MGKIVFVEVLDRRGSVRERIKVDSFPFTIGRGYANAVIVDDRLVSAEHLRLSLDSEGGMIVEDLNTLNGTWLSKPRERFEQHRIPPGGEAVIRVGQTVLRLRGDDFAIEPVTSSRAPLRLFSTYMESKLITSLVFVAGFGLNVLTVAQKIDKKVIWSDLTAMSLLLLIVFALWTGFWAFLSRLVIHSFRFMVHLGISAVASIFFLVFFTATEYFEFIFSAPTAARIAGFVGFAVIFSLLLYGHFSVMSELSGWKRILSSTLIGAVIVGIALLVNYTKGREFSNDLRFSAVIKPVGWKWVRTVSSDEFFGDLGNLKLKLDTMAQKGPKERTMKE